MKSLLLIGFLSFSILLPAQWHSLQGPFGGSIYNIVNAGNSSYVSTLNGLYRSDDEGKNWIRLDDGLPEFHDAHSFCADNDEVFLYYKDAKTNDVGFVYSNDKGTHWIKRPLPTSNWSSTWSNDMAYSGGVLLVPGDQELIESYDKGLSWHSAHLGISSPDEIYYIQANHSYFFVSTSSNTVYRRAIQDSIWQTIYTSSEYFWDLHITDSLIILLINKSPGARSIDNGLTWQTISVEGDGSIADFGDSLYLPYENKIYKSTDKGLNWTLIKSFQSPAFFYFNVVRAGHSLLGILSDEGLIRTENEFDTFETSSAGIISANAYRMVVTDTFLFVLTKTSLERYDFINKKWNNKSLLNANYFKELYYLHDRLFVLSNYEDSLYISTDQGQSFSKVALQIFQIHESQRFKMFEFPDKIMITSIYGSEVSTDNGATWEIIKFDDPVFGSVKPLDFALYNQQLLVAVNNSTTRKIEFYTSSDLKNWNLLPVNFPANLSVNYFNGFNSVGSNLFIKLFTNMGCELFKYDSITHDLSQCQGLSSICISFGSVQDRIIEYNGSLLSCLEDGYYKSIDGGLHWIKVIDDLNANSYSLFNDLAIKDQTIYAASVDYGVLQASWDDLKLAKVKGLVFYDKDNNDKLDVNDEPLTEAFVQLNRSYQYFSTKDNGNFSFLYASAITDTMIPIYHTKYGYFNPKRLPFHPGDTTLLFAYKFPNKIEDVTITAYPLSGARPGFNYYIDIHVKNQGTETCSGDLILNYDDLFNYLSSNGTPDNKIGNTLIWKITDLKTFEERTIRVMLMLPSTVALNTNFKHQLNFTNLSIADIDLTDNEVFIQGTVRSSCDPNEMTVDKEILSKQELVNKQALTYTIYFQNTGNNEAEFVKLSNDLSNFDLNTFQIISASHPYTYQINEYGELDVLYDMIHLPDSISEESKSHGYFCYRIVPIAKKIYSNILYNSAVIYFDYNGGISTNNAITKIQEIVDTKNLSSLSAENIIAIPNPSSGNFEIYSKYLAYSKVDKIQIFNLQGQCVFEIKDKLSQGYKLNLSKLNDGLYFLKIGYSNRMICKLIIQK